MKTVLISIQPQWCELIASGQKTIEVRKSAPKEVPFKGYIYMTRRKPYCLVFAGNGIMEAKNGKVIGEFVCDKVYDLFPWGIGVGATDERGELVIADVIRNNSCLTDDEICEYLNHRAGKAWHISDLKIYDKPKELGEFVTRQNSPTDNCDNCINKKWWREDTAEIAKRICTSCKKDNFRKQITRPPQSWQYVEEL